MEIRFARETDSRQLLEIYRQYIDTTVTFEYVLPTEEEFAGRIREIGGEYPYLVCEEFYWGTQRENIGMEYYFWIEVSEEYLASEGAE